MPEFNACVHWQRQGQSVGSPATDADFTGQRYSRRHRWLFDGGAEVAGSASPHSVPLPWSDPSAVDPEEAFVAALSSCHMLWFLSLAAKAGWVVDDYRDAAVGVMSRNAAGHMAMTLVTLRPAARFGGATAPSRDQLLQLHDQAHHFCYIANSVSCALRCEPA